MNEIIKLSIIYKENTILHLRLSVVERNREKGNEIPLTPDCSTLEEFDRAIESLKQDLEGRIEEARAVFRRHASNQGATIMEPRGPEEIWKAMERSGSIEGMKEIFNPLSLDRRKEVADFVFTRMNIFKGAALAFSQSYDEERGILE